MKKSCVKNRQKVFDKISLLIDAMNLEVLGYLGIKFEKREAYAVDYVYWSSLFATLCSINTYL